jgi:hypothetical protein
MGTKVSAPKQPNPSKLAKKQAELNQKASQSTQKQNMVSTTTPQGSTTYVKDPNSPSGYRQVTTLTPEAQAAYDLQQRFDTGSNEVALNQLGAVGETLSKPVDISTTAIEDHLFDLANSRLAPELERSRAAAESRLYNQGVQPGTEAYDRAMEAEMERSNDAYNQLFLTGRQQGVSELFAQRNQPLNEMNALLSMAQVQQPNQPGLPQAPTINPADLAGYTYQNYQGALTQQQMAAQERAAMYAAMGQTAGGIGGAIATKSDVRAKKDIKRIGETDTGLGIYKYKYKGTDTPQIGLMAQEVEQTNPDAVTEINGIKHVFYDLAV